MGLAGWVRDAVTGSASGAAATLLMTSEMLAWQRWGGGGPLGPVVVTDRVLAPLRLEHRSTAVRRGVESAAHVGFGAGAGAVYAGLSRVALDVVPATGRLPGPLRGAVFALGLWAATYGTAIPALGLVPPPPRDRPGRQPRLVVAHLVYGSVLGALVDRLAGPSRRPPHSSDRHSTHQHSSAQHSTGRHSTDRHRTDRHRTDRGGTVFWSTAAGKLEQAESLDPTAQALEGAVQRVLPHGRVKDALHGVWLGHQLHPLLVALPIGLWSGATVLDLTAGRSARGAAQRLVGVGVLVALPTAASGAADWSELGMARAPKRVGLVHAAANTVTLGLYAASWWARARGNHGKGRGLALAGAAGLAVGGYLGGHLAYAQAVGVNRNADAPKAPRDWTDVGPLGDLAEGQMRRVDAAGQPVLLARAGGELRALLATCSHWGGPLDEGEIEGSGDEARVMCPWHSSHFRLCDGAVVTGPATVPQPAYDVRTSDGRVQVRARV